MVFESSDELIAGVASDTGIDADVVRAVLKASFPSTKAYLLREIEAAIEGDVEAYGFMFTPASRTSTPMVGETPPGETPPMDVFRRTIGTVAW